MPVLIPDIPDDSCRSTPSCWMDEDDDGSHPAPPQQVYLSVPSDHQQQQQQQQQVDLSIRRDRERDGRCGDCGMQTHEFKFDPLSGTYIKVPLSVNGEVHRGRCLLCLPFDAQEARRQQGSSSRPVAGACNSSSSTNCCNHNHNHASPSSSQRRRVSGLTSALGLYGSSDPGAVRNALNSLIEGNNDIVDILFAMKRVPNDPIIQERGCERLWIMSWEDDNAISIGRVGGISIILSAMARFPKNSYLQQCACEALQNLALDEYNIREIAEQGGIDLIVRCMVNHVTVAAIQQSGCTALASMAAEGEYNKDISRAGGVHALILAARQFADEEGVLRCVEDACQAMGFDPKGNYYCHPTPMEATATR